MLDRLDRLVRRSLWVSGGALAVILPLPWLAGLANPSYVLATLVVVAAGLLLALAEAPEDRPLLLGVIGLSLLVQQTTHLVLFWLGEGAGGPFLGPDSTSYLVRAHQLAELGFRLDLYEADRFGTFDLAHIYLFGAAIELLGADLFCLQTVNGGFVALLGGLTFSWSRTVVPRYATVLGTVVGLFPSLAILSSLDLLKDPSVTFFLVLGFWAVCRLTTAEAPAARAAYVLLGAAGLAYVHMSRFYLLTHFEIATGCALLWAVLRDRRGEATDVGDFRSVRPGQGPPIRARVVVSVVLLFGIAELAPAAFGWPVSPQFYLDMVEHSLGEPKMSQYAPGLVDELVPVGSPMAEPPEDKGTREDASRSGTSRPGRRVGASTPDRSDASGSDPGSFPPPGGATATLREYGAAPAIRETPAERVSPVSDPPQGVEAKGGVVVLGVQVGRPVGFLVGGAANLLRRLLGPFVWILPERWSARYILTGDYLLYPGMLVWYLVWPFVAVGLAVSGWRLLRGWRTSLPLAVLTLYSLISIAHYLTLNLSYRQRETLFPFLALFVLLGLAPLKARRGLRVAYGVYWLGIFAVATVHLLVRARVVG